MISPVRGKAGRRRGNARVRSLRSGLAAAQLQKLRLHLCAFRVSRLTAMRPSQAHALAAWRADASAAHPRCCAREQHSCLGCSLTTALRVRRSPASATRSQQPSCDGCGGASGGAAPAEHKAVAARASTATPGCYNPGGCGWGRNAPQERWAPRLPQTNRNTCVRCGWPAPRGTFAFAPSAAA